jgi:uncharacterized protein (DUF736 family)
MHYLLKYMSNQIYHGHLVTITIDSNVQIIKIELDDQIKLNIICLQSIDNQI